MDPTDNTGKARTPKQATGTNQDTATAASSAVTDRPFGPDGATILATEHWSLLGTRSMIWNEAMSRTTVFLTVLSASIVALSLLANATGFGRHTTTLALVLLPVVFLLGLATYLRLVEINSEDVAITRAMNRLRYAYLVMAPDLRPYFTINSEDVAITRAMNRLRYAYLVMAPDLRPYFTAGRYDDERGIATTYMLGMRGELQTWPHFLVTTPTMVATVDAAVGTAIVVVAALALEAPTGAAVAAGVVAFLVIWGALFSLQRSNLRVLRRVSPRFPTPPDEP